MLARTKEQRMSKGLVIVDIQNDYFPGGKMPLVNIHDAGARAAKLLEHFRGRSWPTFHIQHIFESPDAPFFVAGTDGIEINECVRPQAGETVVEKHFPNSFRESKLLDEIKAADVDELVICGAMSHMCIDATTRAAADMGFDCTLIEDSCATADLEWEGKTIPAAQVHGSYMSALGWAYAKLMSTEDFVSTGD